MKILMLLCKGLKKNILLKPAMVTSTVMIMTMIKNYMTSKKDMTSSDTDLSISDIQAKRARGRAVKSAVS